MHQLIFYRQLWLGWVVAALCVALATTSAIGQVRQLTGKVVDEREQPLPGATIRLSPMLLATQSDENGAFLFSALPAGAYTVQVSLVGYAPQSLSLAARTGSSHLLVRLKISAQELTNVVIEANPIALRKQEESLNLEVVGGAFLQRYRGGSLMQTLERLPGVKIIGIGSGQSKPLIRGLGFNRVVVVENGVKHEGQQWGADHGLEIDQFAAEQVEILKGAASFVYGSDAIGGAIEVKPAPVPAAHTAGGSVDLIGKSNNALYGTSANVFGRGQHWFANARATYQNYGDYRVPTDQIYVYDFAVRLHNNQLRNTAGRETGLHLHTGYVGEQLRSVLYLSYVGSRSGFFANAHGLEPRRVDTDLHDASSRDILLPRQQVSHLKLINRSQYQLPGTPHRLEAELGYQHNFRQEFSQYVNHGYMPPVYPSDLPIPQDLERAFDKHVYAGNLRAYLRWGRHALTAGVNSEVQDNRINGWSFLVPAFRQQAVGAFAYDKFQLNDHTLLHGAVRYDHAHLHITPYTDWFPSATPTSNGALTERLVRAEALTRTFNSVVWSAGINYNLGQWELKGNVGKSFRVPIAKELAANGVNYHYFSYERGDPALDPEQSYQLDVSLGWKQDKWSVQLSPFFNYFPNYIYLNPTPEHDYFYGAGNQVFQYAQSRVRRYGGEVQLRYQLLPTLRTELLAEYLRATQLSGAKRGFTLPFSPPASALLNLTWSPRLSGELSGSYFAVDYRRTAAQPNIVPPERKTLGYQLFHVQAGTRLTLGQQPLLLSLQVQNLLNTRYLNHTSFYRLIGLPEAGRNVILTLNLPFTITPATHEKN
ncbi:TonB-dependent receptor [Hymenobacter aerilatus]|uniref:TonB-dependent receptor n=1 Tax=Hymenobacter aerilatus TaxID=2932251 RepID=A0A8T9T3U6_9BACT|nr:TonB-dependent receptor [Hymenobacter aerilatus]UOR06776.1 TonB-dependent receptor [Hymenobacter aerilatus]